MTWDELDFWSSKAWTEIQEKLDEMDSRGHLYNPKRELLFAALDATPFDRTKVAIFGQDPYPDPRYATGLAFSIPSQQKGTIPGSLANILKEYCSDLHLPFPSGGNLLKWCSEGVLLWNVVPICKTGRPGSCLDWDQWTFLTGEIIERLSDQGAILVFLGAKARSYTRYVLPYNLNNVIEKYHPSPRAQINKHAYDRFLGCRLFSTINDMLVSEGEKPIDWRLE